MCLLAFATAGQAQQVLQHKGLDARVDYAKLVEIGPWDDRNYQLTQKDLSLLAPNENELRAQIPAFFRVEMRRANPGMQRTGPAQYPRSALQIFRLEYGGYLVNGKLYPGAEYEDGRYSVLMKQGITEEHFAMEKFLTGEVRITSPNGAAESAIKINPVNTDLVIAGSNGPGSGQIMHFSTDGGENWSTAAALPNGGTCCDPTVDWSSDGTLAYAATLGNCGGGGCQIWVYRSSDGGQTWNDLPGSPPRRTLNTGGGNDKEFIHVDKFTTSPFVDNIYATWHANNVMQFSRSSDSGETWATQAFSSASDQLGIGSDIVTDQSGAVYYFWPAFNSQRILLRKSTDGGASFGSVIEVDSTEASFTFPVPSMDTRDVFVYVSADADLSTGPFGGSIYAAWTDSTGPTGNNASNNHARIQVGYSRDGGNTWTVTTPHETADSNSVDRWHQWLAVGPDGQVHVVFYDTRRDPSRSSVDLFYSFSSDGAQTWSTPTRITAQQSPNIGDSFEFGDYNGLDIVLNDMIAIFTDNRNEGGGGADSVDVYAAGIPVTGGCTPQAVADAGADRTINEGDSTTLGTPALGGHTYSWSPGGATTAQISVSPTTSTTYTVTATTSCGSANDSVTVTVIPAGGGGPQTAVFNAGLGAPACLTPGSSCDSTTLLVGRDGNGPEPNQPNTLDGCADGTSGTFQSDESNDSLFVTTLDGSNMVEGATVRIDAEVWAWTTPAEDTLDLFFTADANNPSWTLITSITPTVVGQQTLSATYTLPAGALQAVRAQFRYQSTNAPCSAGNWNDRDDLVFAVGTAAGCSVNADCDDGAFCNGAETCNTGTGVCEAGTPPVCDDGVSCTVDSCNEATDSCDAAPNDSLCDNGLFCDGAETCAAINDCQAGTAPNCNDGVSCTVDSCNEGTDSCDNNPDDSVCDNGLFCDGAETCDVVNDCQAGTNPCSGSQTCNETADICEGGSGCLHDVDFESGAGGWTGNTGSCTTGDFIVGTPDATAWQ
ncbi:MAG: sialidase family protein, partial [Acidobacteriota bacterium]